MRSFTKFVGKLPFAGKMSIKPLVFGLYQSTNKEERNKSYFWLMLLLILFVLLHFVQMRMGMEAMSFSSPVWAKIVSVLYIAANFSVVLTQFHLLCRATRFYFKGKYPRKRRSYKEHSGFEVVAMLVVTLGGQIIFLSQFTMYR